MSGVQCLEEAGTNQVLIFVHSRKETYKTAKFLQEEAMRNDDLAKFVPSSSASREVLQVLFVPASFCRCLCLLLPLAADDLQFVACSCCAAAWCILHTCTWFMQTSIHSALDSQASYVLNSMVSNILAACPVCVLPITVCVVCWL